LPNGVVGYLRPEVKNILAPLPTKTTEFEVEKRCKIAEEAKTELYCDYFNLFRQ